MESVQVLMSHARIDGDGFVVALLNGALIPNLEHQADVVPAPEGAAPPLQAWQRSEATGWHLVPDYSNTPVYSLATGARLSLRPGQTLEEAGGTLEPPVLPDPEPPKPSVCTPAQGLVALYALQQITAQDVEAAIDAIPDPVQRYTAQIGFTRATEWRRDSASMQATTLLLGLTEADVDALFAYAVGVLV